MTAKMARKSAPKPVQDFGNARSVQLISGSKSSVAMGMAAVVSPDGYALTAGHVVEDLPVSILKPKGLGVESDRGVGELRNAEAYFGTMGSAERLSLLNARYKQGQKLVRTPARVVRRFRDVDLALVKLPVGTTKWFHLSPTMPPPNQQLFITRNPVNHGGPTTLEGKAQFPEKLTAKGTSAWWVDSNVPVVPGDSGGAAFDAQGRLVGCVALGNIWRIVSNRTRASGDRWTSIMGLDASEIQRTIDLDRRRLASNLALLKESPEMQAAFDELIPKALPKRTDAIPVSGLTETQVMERVMEAKDRQKGFFW
jgi:hypothetical protein